MTAFERELVLVLLRAQLGVSVMYVASSNEIGKQTPWGSDFLGGQFRVVFPLLPLRLLWRSVGISLDKKGDNIRDILALRHYFYSFMREYAEGP